MTDIESLMKHGLTPESYRNLASKVDTKKLITLLEKYSSKVSESEEVARTIADKIRAKYANQTISKKKLIEKIAKYQQKHKLTDVSIDQLLALVINGNDVNWENKHKSVPTTRISSVLGLSHEDGLNIPRGDEGIVKEIIRSAEVNKTLHAQVLLQATTYEDCSAEALIGEYNTNYHSKYNYIHPIIAALFLPKMKYLEEHMLFASIGNIVTCKYNKQPLATVMDYALFHALVHDPNDVVCDSTHPFKDILARTNLQEAIWKCVLELRQGKYYAYGQSFLMDAVDKCKSNVFDSPDLVQVKDDGAMLRKIMSAFSMRPLIVSTQSIPTHSQNIYTNPIMHGVSQEITTLPMINLYLPPSGIAGNDILNLSDSLKQYQWFMDGGRNIVPKYQNVIHNKGVLIFYVNRKYQAVNINKHLGPFNFNMMPHSLTGFDKINDSPIDFEFNMSIGEESFSLRSVVFTDTLSSDTKIVSGSSAGIVSMRNGYSTGMSSEAYIYNPREAGSIVRSVDVSAGAADVFTTRPINETHIAPTNDEDRQSFYGRASKNGTIFIYQKVEQF